jgi:FAD/FMN-containing dehydrogenase
MALARSPRRDPRGGFDVSAFAAGITGSVIRPEDAAFADARLVKNTRYDRRPSLIVRAANAADVARSVVFARDHELEIAVRGGSHSVAGHSTVDGGIVIDLSAMKGLHIDPERRLAWAQAGLTAGEVTTAAAAHGLAVPFGDTASVGIGGLTTGGGIGWLVRKYGMTIDSLVGVDIVTADGRLVSASEDENPDLFWAVRGGGGNFGIVTRFQFRLHPVDMVLAGALVLPPTADVLRALVPIAASAPEELTTISMLMPIPPMPTVPEDVQGKLGLVIMFVYAGDPEAGQAAIAPFRQVATPLAELVAPMPYPGIYQFTDGESEPGPWITRSVFLDALDDAAIDAILAHHAAPSSPLAMTQIRVLGGAMARVPSTATAFAHREADVMVAILTPYQDPAEAASHEAWTSGYFLALRPGATGVYSNFLEDEGEDRIREAYPGLTYQRLAQVKRRYDPTNLFHRNQNIRPAAAS